MILCQVCETPNADDSNFCKKCGSPLQTGRSSTGQSQNTRRIPEFSQNKSRHSPQRSRIEGPDYQQSTPTPSKRVGSHNQQLYVTTCPHCSSVVEVVCPDMGREVRQILPRPIGEMRISDAKNDLGCPNCGNVFVVYWYFKDGVYPKQKF